MRITIYLPHSLFSQGRLIKNYDNQVQGQASGKKNTEEPPAVAINCITFN
jgi:hypothetical protein